MKRTPKTDKAVKIKINYLTINRIFTKICSDGGRRLVCDCICKCGKTVQAFKWNIENGDVKSCGCFNKIKSLKHGKCKIPEYTVWSNLKQRCCNTKNPRFGNYGGRGIKVCQRWLDSFENFYQDMKQRPTRFHSLDRVNNDKSYCKRNCRWATKKEQANNTRQNRRIRCNGQNLTITQWAKELGVTYCAITYRLAQGLTEEQAILIPFERHTKPLKKRRI